MFIIFLKVKREKGLLRYVRNKVQNRFIQMHALLKEYV